MLLSILFIAIAQTPGPSAAGTSATGVLEPREMPFHRIARFRVEVDGPADAEITLAPWPAAIPGLDVTFEPAETAPASGGRQSFVQQIRLAPLQAQQFTLPPVRVLVNGVAAATLEPGVLDARPLTPEEELAARAPVALISLADLKEERGGLPWIPIFAGAMLITLVAAVFVWRYRSGPLLPRRTALTPLAEALARLEVVERDMGRKTCGDVYVALSAAVRDYLERGYGLHVTELSTPEFVDGPLAALALEPSLRRTLSELLVEADRVKFAQLERDETQQRAAVAAARELVLALDRPAPPDTSVQGAA